MRTEAIGKLFQAAGGVVLILFDEVPRICLTNDSPALYSSHPVCDLTGWDGTLPRFGNSRNVEGQRWWAAHLRKSSSTFRPRGRGEGRKLAHLNFPPIPKPAAARSRGWVPTSPTNRGGVERKRANC